MKQKSLTVMLLLTILMITSHRSVSAETMIVGGEMVYRYRIRSDKQELLDAFPQYENESNSQLLLSHGPGAIIMENRARLEPFESRIPFPVGERYRNDPEMERYLEYATRQTGVRITITGNSRTESPVEKVNSISDAGVRTLRRKAIALTGGAKNQREAVEQIILALREDIRYRLNVSPEPIKVLQSALADCDGYSNTAVLLLRTLGIPARMVGSWIPPGHLWGYGAEGSGGFHAHLEVYYEDAGWVSHDVQATLHFVDPYHIVGYPRSGVSFEALSDDDGRVILGLSERPKGENHFFRRKIAGEFLDPLFVGSVRGPGGELLRDSPRSGDWIYLRGARGSGEGILILPSGRFTLPGGEFFYTDNRGLYLEHQVDLSGLSPGDVKERQFDLTGQPDFLLQLSPSVRKIYRWHRGGTKQGGTNRDSTNRGEWSLEAIPLSSDGSLRIFSTTGEWIISTDREGRNSRYRFTPSTGAGEEAGIEDLEPYLEAGYSYLRFDGDFDRSYRIKLLDRSGRSFDAGRVGESAVVMIPEGNFDRLFLQENDKLLFTTLSPSLLEEGFSLSPVDPERFSASLLLPDLSGGKSGMIVEKAGSRFRILLRLQGRGERIELHYPPAAREELEELSFMVGRSEMTPLKDLLR